MLTRTHRYLATIMAQTGGSGRLELVDTQRRVHVRGGQKKVDSYLRPDALGIVPDDAPHTVR
jgi:hypothetical protein